MQWRADYFSLINKIEVNDIDWAPAIALKSDHLPSKLYQYRKLDPAGRMLENLRNGRTWLSEPNTFNDPYDSAFSVSAKDLLGQYGGITEKIMQEVGIYDTLTPDEKKYAQNASDPLHCIASVLYAREGKTVPHEMVSLIEDITTHRMSQRLESFEKQVKNSLRVCCFSENIFSPIMWSHYADNHTGFCLEYDTSIWEKTPLILRCLHPVYYSDTRFDATKHLGKSYKAPHVLIPLIAACNKSTEWAYEQEWRFVMIAGILNKNPFWCFPGLCRIILGSRSDPALESKLKSIPCLKDIPFIQAHLSKTRFAVEC